MAGKIIYPYYMTGVNLYVRIRRPADGYVWNVSGAFAGTWETFNTTDTIEHALALVEAPAGSYEYEVEFPAGIEAGVFLVEVRLRAGANPETADRVLATGPMQWDGTSEIPLSKIDNKTTNLPADPAAVGSAMTLADASIKKVTHDNSTSFAVELVDAGSTQIARTGADSDTLKSLSDQMDSIKTDTSKIGSQEITYVGPAVGGGNFEIIAGDDYAVADGRQLGLTISPTPSSSDLNVAATMRFIDKATYTGSLTDEAVLETAATVTLTAGDLVCVMPLTAAETLQLDSPAPPAADRNYIYNLVATTATGDRIIRVARGRVTVQKGIAAKT